MSGWLRPRLPGGTPLRSRAVAACSAGAWREGSACQTLPPLWTRTVKRASCGRFATQSWRACRAADRPRDSFLRAPPDSKPTPRLQPQLRAIELLAGTGLRARVRGCCTRDRGCPANGPSGVQGGVVLV